MSISPSHFGGEYGNGSALSCFSFRVIVSGSQSIEDDDKTSEGTLMELVSFSGEYRMPMPRLRMPTSK